MAHESVLVVEDDASILAGIEMNLMLEGYKVRTARDGAAGLESFEKSRPDLVILDVMMPVLNGLDVLSRIRAKDPTIPVLMLSARDGELDKITGLDLGADDYITKPFALKELLARVNAALRRPRLGQPKVEEVRFGDVIVDLRGRTVTRLGKEVGLSAREFDLLLYLMRSRGAVLTRDQILSRVWGSTYEGTDRTVDNFVARLREKLEVKPEEPRHIVTVRGVGYRFEP